MSAMRSFARLYPRAPAYLCVGALLFVLPGILGHLNRPVTRLPGAIVAQIPTHFAIADFDGDLQPDVATIRVTHDLPRAAEYFLELQLSSGARPSIGLLGPAGGLQVTSQDVNGDKIADLVVTSPMDAEFVAILVNDGRGNFRKAERSEYPEVGKRSEAQLVARESIAEPQLALGQNSGPESGEATRASWGRTPENRSKILPELSISLWTFLASAAASRAPPLV